MPILQARPLVERHDEEVDTIPLSDYILQWPIRKKDPIPTDEEVMAAETTFVAKWLDEHPDKLALLLRDALLPETDLGFDCLDANLYGYHFAVTTSPFFQEPTLIIPYPKGDDSAWKRFAAWCRNRQIGNPREAWKARGLPKIATRRDE